MKWIELLIVVASPLCAGLQAQATTRYVNLNNPNPAPPYTSWAAAATNIQDAIDASINGDLVLVTNGVYQTGSRLTDDGTQNRVVVTNSIEIQAVNGPSVTTIDGLNAVRCVYLSTGAVLTGFTLTRGSAAQGGGAYGGTLDGCTLSGNSAHYGGGAYACLGNSCTLSNNTAIGTNGYEQGEAHGGGACACTLNNCTISGNSAYSVYSNDYSGGGAYESTLNNCALSSNSARYGGGAYNCTLRNCSLSNNAAVGDYGYGGGAWGGTLNNCTLRSNSANGLAHPLFWGIGGGSAYSTLNNCTVCSNTATGDNGTGGGAHGATLNNCIVFYNSAPINPNCNSSTLNYSCTTPLPPSGLGNISYPPLFVALNVGNVRLQAGSPCINSGRNAYAPGSTDLDGNPRVSGGTVDMGAYEFQNPASVISYAWLQSYGLPTEGAADYADPDNDGMNVWQEWGAGTNPTNAASVLKMLSANPGSTNVVVTWSSVSNRTYSLARATNLMAVPAFSVAWSNIAGLAGTTSFTDTNQPTGPAVFYRVAVQRP